MWPWPHASNVESQWTCLSFFFGNACWEANFIHLVFKSHNHLSDISAFWIFVMYLSRSSVKKFFSAYIAYPLCTLSDTKANMNPGLCFVLFYRLTPWILFHFLCWRSWILYYGAKILNFYFVAKYYRSWVLQVTFAVGAVTAWTRVYCLNHIIILRTFCFLNTCHVSELVLHSKTRPCTSCTFSAKRQCDCVVNTYCDGLQKSKCSFPIRFLSKT